MSFALPFAALADSQEVLALAWEAAGAISAAVLLSACGGLLARHWRR